MMEEKMRFGGLEEQFSQITGNKIPFLQMLHECIEPATEPPNQIIQSLLQIQTLEPESSSLTIKRDPDQDPAATRVLKEKRKRKRTRAPKDKDEVEKQRMTHIAVERNRRRQMNQHLNSLRSLMPPSFLQRGDQASIVGGAIDFIKELEQLLQSMEAEKDKEGARACSVSTSSEDGFTARFGGGEKTEVEATVIESHVRLKVRCKRGKGQILKAIVSIEELKLSILHLTISSSSSQYFFFYSFNLKIEQGCKLGSADEIATAVHQIFETNQNQR